MGMDARSIAGGAVGWLRSLSVRAILSFAAPFGAALLAGCQADPNMQLVERELRLQDSHIFDLEEHLADCHATVAEYRREIASLRRQLDDKAPDPPAAPTVGDYDREGNDWDPDTRLRPPLPSGPSLPDIEEGDEIPPSPLREPLDADSSLERLDELGDAEAPEFRPTAADAELPALVPTPSGDAMPLPRSQEDGAIPAGGPVDEGLPFPRLGGLDHKVEQIGLRLMVRYYAAENTPVELQALLEPQDADAEQVVTEGDVSIMVVAMDGSAEKPLARWDFTEEEARRHWRRSRLGTGMLFELPWPDTPQPGKYQLWARMVGDDGRKHLSSVDFEVHESALADGPGTLPLSRSLPGPDAAAEPHLADESGASPSPLEEAPHEPEPFDPLSGKPEPLHSTPDAVRATASPPAEPSRAAAASLTWKASVEAARLPRLRQPARVAQTPTSADRTTEPQDRGALVPWSPDRPTTSNAPEPQAAEQMNDWSPYR